VPPIRTSRPRRPVLLSSNRPPREWPMPGLRIQLPPFRLRLSRQRRPPTVGPGTPRTPAVGSREPRLPRSRLRPAERCRAPHTAAQPSRPSRPCLRRRRRPGLWPLRLPPCPRRRGCSSHRPSRCDGPIRSTGREELRATGPAARSSRMNRRRRRRLSVPPRSRSRRQALFSSDLSGVVKVRA
jgi:hypothetical protein